MSKKGKLLFPTEEEIQNGACKFATMCPNKDSHMNLGFQPGDLYYEAEHGDIRFLHCPFQALPNNSYNCSELETYRFYDTSNIKKLYIFFKDPVAELVIFKCYLFKKNIFN